MEHNTEREIPKEVYSERDIACVGVLVGEDSYLYHLAKGQRAELIPELSSFLTTNRLIAVLTEEIEAESQQTTDLTDHKAALRVVVAHLIQLCERVSGQKLQEPTEEE